MQEIETRKNPSIQSYSLQLIIILHVAQIKL